MILLFKKVTVIYKDDCHLRYCYNFSMMKQLAFIILAFIMVGCTKTTLSPPHILDATSPLPKVTSLPVNTPSADNSATPQYATTKSITPSPTEISIKLPGSIAYIAYGETARIGILDQDLNMIELVEYCTWCKQLSWSPDGNWIAFPEEPEERSSLQIFVVNTNNKETKKITTGSKTKWGMSWSPDGKYLVYVEEGEPTDIVKISADGKYSQKITYTPGYEFDPAWSPDGKQIAFFYNEERGDPMEIWSMDPDGKNRRKITTHHAGFTTLSWSPDSKSILFVSETDCGELLSVNVDSGNIKHLLSIPGCIENPSWSPEGRHIMFIGSDSKADPKDSPNWEITIWDSNSDTLTRIETERDWRPIVSIWNPLMK
jgi:Tol biopolymer transport system component